MTDMKTQRNAEAQAKHRQGLKMDVRAIKALLEDLRADMACVRLELAKQRRDQPRESRT